MHCHHIWLAVRVYSANKRPRGRNKDRGAPARDTRKDQEPWPKDRPPFTCFTVFKTNKDTMSAIKEISFMTRRTEKSFSFAGTKDKRAITTQQVSSKFLRLHQLKKAAPRLAIKGIYVGNVTYIDRPLRLGNVSVRWFCYREIFCSLLVVVVVGVAVGTSYVLAFISHDISFHDA